MDGFVPADRVHAEPATPITAETARTPERQAFVTHFSQRLAFVVQKMGAAIEAQHRLRQAPESPLRQTAYEAELIALEGASDLLGETIYDFLEAGVDVAALMNHIPARLSRLVASTSAGNTSTSSPRTAAGGRDSLSTQSR